MENLFLDLDRVEYLFMWKKKSRHYSNTVFSLALKSQRCRNPGSLESRSCWQVGGGGGNLFNGKLMRPWAPRIKQTWRRKRAKDSKRLYWVHSDGVIRSGGSKISEGMWPSPEAVETNRVNEHGRARRERHGSQQHWHKPQTLRKRDQTEGTQHCGLVVEGKGGNTEPFPLHLKC